jgi:glycosyltransferase involved in cell wall biosynthesis
MIRFAVILPTKNRCHLLGRALDSVLTQEHPQVRTVVVNDGSSDGTHDYLAGLNDPRITVIELEGGGVNAARNAAVRTLAPDEWAVMLDDDDVLLPNALTPIARLLEEAPEYVRVAFFNTRIRTPKEEFIGGYRFDAGESWHETEYAELFSKYRLRGDCKPVVHASVFGQGYSFSEDVNGFESEFYFKLARDGVGIRYYTELIMYVDQAHGEERLSNTAAVRDPASFVRVHQRLMRDHRALLHTRPDLAKRRSFSAAKVALRAGDFLNASIFLIQGVLASFRLFGAREK